MEVESKLIKKIFMQCPLCGRKHYLELRSSMETFPVKGLNATVEYEYQFYHCKYASGEEKDFCDAKLVAENTKRGQAAYQNKRYQKILKEKYGIE